MLNGKFKEVKKNIQSGNKYYNDEFKKSFIDFVSKRIDIKKYEIKFSMGYECWINEPFIGIRNVTASKSFVNGLFILLLFKEDGSGFYLSFKQGELNPDFNKRVDITNYLIKKIKENSNLNIPEGFKYQKMVLNNSTSILSKFYDINTKKFEQDFSRFIVIYEYLLRFYNNYDKKDFVDIESHIKNILNQFPREKKKPYNGNEFVEWINTDFYDEFNTFLSDCGINDYDVLFLIGKSDWPNLFHINLINNSFQPKFDNSKFNLYILFNHHRKEIELGLILSRTYNHIIESRIDFLVTQIKNKFTNIINQINFKDNKIIIKKISYDKLYYKNIKREFKNLTEIYEYLIPKYENFLDNEVPEKNDLRDSINRKIWAINLSTYENNSEELWDEFKSNSYITTGFIYNHNDIDYSIFKNKNALGRNTPYEIPNKVVNYTWRFVNFIKKDDILVVYGNLSIKGIAIVTSDFVGINDKNSINNLYNVKWITFFDLSDFNYGRSKHEISELNVHTWNKLLLSLSRYNEKLFKNIADYLYNLFKVYVKRNNVKKNFNNKKDAINSIWKEIVDKNNSGLNISDEIWDKLLLNFFESDLKVKIKERENFTDEDMDIVANLFFNTINNLIKTNKVQDQKKIINEFIENKYSSKLKSMDYFIKLLYFLDDNFYIIDKKINKSLELFSLMFNIKFKLNRDLGNYFYYNQKFKDYLQLIHNNNYFRKFNFNNFENFLLFSYCYTKDDFGKVVEEEKILPVNLIENVGTFKLSNIYSKINLSKNLLLSTLDDFAISNNIINQICASLNAGKHIILEGTPGTGKTDLAIKFAEISEKNKFNNGYILTTATSDWSTFDTIGGLMQNQDAVLNFHQGKFLEAIAQNKWLIIDEINRADIDKAFGPLFTVLSGQNVELPYKINNKSIKIKISDNIYSSYDIESSTYLIGKNWRIIGTMNVDDKDSLFDLSYAFMRRFMFIDIDLPVKKDYLDLISNWSSQIDEYYVGKLQKLYDIVNFRKIGPAIFKDMCEYIKFRCELDNSNPDLILSEAISSFIIPQLEGLNRNKIKNIKELFDELELLDYLEFQLNDLIPMY